MDTGVSISFVKRVLHRYIICERFNSRPYSYHESPNLEEARLNDNAFSGTEIDYFGRLYCKDIYGRNNLDEFKCYVVLYICESTRSLILELVPDASSKYFVIVLEGLYHAEAVQER